MSGAVSAFARFILIPLIGISAAKCGIIRDRGRRGISFFLVNICYPVMILANIWQTDFRLLWVQSAFTVAFCAVLTTFLFVAGNIYFHRKAYQNPSLWNFMLGIGNVAYIGIPILNMFFGSPAVIIAIVYSSVGDLFIWLLYYPAVLSGSRRPLRVVLLNPCLIILLVSIVLSIARIPVPSALVPVLKSSTAVVSVVALFYVGIILADTRIREIFRSSAPWKFSAIKVMVLPTICFFILWPFTGLYKAAVLSILAGSPAPILSMVWTKENPSAQREATNCFVASTLLFLVLIIPLCMVF